MKYLNARFHPGFPCLGKVNRRWRTFPLLEVKAIDAHTQPAHFDVDVW